jgi:ABC-type transport system substrate-binding protein
VSIDLKEMFGRKGKGAVPPPPYVVQIEINNKNPLRIDQQNEMLMQMYTMSAQAQQPFPLSVLLSMLNIEAKDRMLPAIQAAEAQQQQMQMMQQQMEQMGAQMEQMSKENASLKRVKNQLVSSMANLGARTGGSSQDAMQPREEAAISATGTEYPMMA